jgi:hypothetical protein
MISLPNPPAQQNGNKNRPFILFEHEKYLVVDYRYRNVSGVSEHCEWTLGLVNASLSVLMLVLLLGIFRRAPFPLFFLLVIYDTSSIRDLSKVS